jgi:uncharacterized membrane protein YbaN (DUF454 family)
MSQFPKNTRSQSSAQDEVRLVKSAHLRILLMVLGMLSLALGLIGIFLPVLPTTPFLLVAAACFARASERYYRMLLDNPYCGPLIREWRTHGTIPKRAKILAILMIVFGLGTSIVFFVPYPTAKIVLAVIGLSVILYLLRVPTRPDRRD